MTAIPDEDAVSLDDDPGGWEFASVSYCPESEMIRLEVEAGYTTVITMRLTKSEAIALADILRRKATQ